MLSLRHVLQHRTRNVHITVHTLAFIQNCEEKHHISTDGETPKATQILT